MNDSIFNLSQVASDLLEQWACGNRKDVVKGLVTLSKADLHRGLLITALVTHEMSTVDLRAINNMMEDYLDENPA